MKIRLKNKKFIYNFHNRINLKLIDLEYVDSKNI